MRREARKLFNRLKQFNEFAEDYHRLVGELENDGGHYYPLMWLYPTGKYYPTIQWRWNPYRNVAMLEAKAIVSRN
ncbi:unnamed protein product [marine sediment metagenome]|uniref:Uncharacterized protein n=1 Tax=marine sediment metagenome TaxID=412755 RepID=X1TMR1_9ZZZZ